MNAQTISLPRAFQLNSPSLRLGAILAGLLTWVQMASPGLVGIDGYYHLKMAALMRADPTPEFIWLPLTILNPKDFVDHHWLFHILLTPFAGNDLITGGRIAAVIFAAAALTIAGWLLQSRGVPGATLWAIGILASSSAFVYRLSMPRAQSLSLLWLLVAIHLMLEKRERWLILLGLTYVWLYDAFPLLWAVAAVYVASVRLIEGHWRWNALIYSTLGIGLGLVFNPYFPHNLIFIYHHLTAKLDLTGVPVGNEWYPYDTLQLVKNSGLALVAFVGGAFALGWQKQRLSLPTAFTFGLAIAFGLMLLMSRRFVEYFPAFAVLFCAFAWQPVLSGRSLARPVAIGLVATLGIATALSVRDARAAVRADLPADYLAGAARWLATHTPQGTRVFQTDWDDFPRLFFYNSRDVYTVGLDPTYLQRADPALYSLWTDLTQGRGLDVSAAIRKHFGADYVVSDLKHKAFLHRAETDPQFQEVYRDNNSIIFRITDT